MTNPKKDPEKSAEESRSDRVKNLADALDAFIHQKIEPGKGNDLSHTDPEVRDLLELMLDKPPEEKETSPPQPPLLPSRIGEKLGDFQILREIGSGGMGVVYLAKQVSLDRNVALKVLPRHLSFSPQRLARFQREAIAAGRLSHPNVVPVFAVGEQDGVHFFAMEYIDGQSLSEIISEMKSLPLEDALDHLLRWGKGEEEGRASTPGTGLDRRAILASGLSGIAVAAGIGLRVAQALADAHEQGIIHRDIKPSNILLDHFGTPLVADFGLAKEEGAGDLSVTGDLLGTPYYMAPERITGPSSSIDARADIFSLGVTLYELLTLTRPFEAETAQEVMKLITHREPRPIRKIAGHVPRDLETIVMRALEKDPDRRYKKAIHLAADFQNFLELRPILARPIGTIERILRGIKRNPAPSLAAALFISLIVGGPIVFGIQERAARRAIEEEKEHVIEQRNRAENERDQKTRALERSLGLYLSAQSAALTSNHPSLSLLLAIEGARRAPGPISTGALYQSLLPNLGPGAETKTLVGHEGALFHGSFFPDGNVLTGSDDKTARMWDPETGQDLVVYRGHKAPVRGARISPDGTRVVTRSRDGTVRIFAASSGEEVAVLQHGQPVGALAISPDGRFITSGSRNGEVSIFTREGILVHSVVQGSGAVLDLAIDRNSKRFATASFDGKVRLYDLPTGKLIRGSMSHDQLVNSVFFSHDGERIVSGSRDRTAKVWSVPEGDLLLTLGTHLAEVSVCSMTPDDRIILTGSADGTARTWDSETGKPLQTLRHQDCVVSAEFDADGDRILTASWDGTAALWNTSTGEELARFRGHEDRIHSAKLSPEGTRVLTTSQDNTARLWNGKTTTSHPLILKTNSNLTSGSYVPNTSFFFTGYQDGGCVLWDLDSMSVIQSFRAHRLPVTAVDISSSGEHALSASLDRTVRIWDLASFDCLSVIRVGSPVSACSFDRAGDRIVTVSRNQGTIIIWDWRKKEKLVSLQERPASVWCANFSPDGRLLVTSDIGVAQLWDAITGEKIATLKAHRDWVKWAEFSHDGKKLITASRDGTACIWNVSLTPELQTRPLLTLKGHKLGLWSATLDPQGTQVVTTSEDRTSRLWDATTGEELAVLEGHGGHVLHATFRPDGAWFATISRDGSARFWPMNPLALAVSQKPRDLTRKERDRYGVWPSRNREDSRAAALARRKAEVLVDTLSRELVLVADVEERLSKNHEIDPRVRAAALELVSHRSDHPEHLNNESWAIIEDPGRNTEAYTIALRWAKAAREISPKNGIFINTIGVAQFRAGLLADAAETLSRSDEMNGDLPLDTAFLAMTFKKLDRNEEAAAAFSRLEKEMRNPLYAQDPRLKEVYREAAELLQE